MDLPLVIPAPSIAAYDAYVTYTQDEGIGYVNPLELELWLPFPGPDAGGQVVIVGEPDAPPPPRVGRGLAAMLLSLQAVGGLDRALLKVHGVPWPQWAVDVYATMLDELAGRLPTDLLGVDGYRWTSWVIARGASAAESAVS